MNAAQETSRTILAEVIRALTADVPHDLPTASPAVGMVTVVPDAYPETAPSPIHSALGRSTWAGLVAQSTVDRLLTQLDPDAVSARDPAAGPAVVFGRLDLEQFVNDFCVAPARWPIPWPLIASRPWWPGTCHEGGALAGADVLAAAARFELAAAGCPEDHPLRPALRTAADTLFDTGLTRLAGEAKHRLQPTLVAVALAKHQ